MSGKKVKQAGKLKKKKTSRVVNSYGKSNRRAGETVRFVTIVLFLKGEDEANRLKINC